MTSQLSTFLLRVYVSTLHDLLLVPSVIIKTQFFSFFLLFRLLSFDEIFWGAQQLRIINKMEHHNNIQFDDVFVKVFFLKLSKQSFSIHRASSCAIVAKMDSETYSLFTLQIFIELEFSLFFLPLLRFLSFFLASMSHFQMRNQFCGLVKVCGNKCILSWLSYHFY